MIDNPYRAPHQDGTPEPTIDARRAAKAFATWLFGAALVGGGAMALQAAPALARFDGLSYLGRFLALSAFRMGAAHIAASAASVAIVVAMHPSAQHGAASRRAVPLWLIYAAVPLSTPVAAFVMIAGGFATATLAYDVAVPTLWHGVFHFIRVEDALSGFVCACAYALVLGAIATVVGPQLRMAARRGLATKIVVGVLATGLVTGIVGGTVGAVCSSLVRTSSD